MDDTATSTNARPLLGSNEAEKEALRDFWNVYEAHYDEITAESTELLADDPEFGPLLKTTSEEETRKQNQESRERLRAAIVEDRWDEYHEYMRAQGAVYAQMGISFAGWFRVVGVIRPRLRRMLIDAYPDELERARSAIGAMDLFLDNAMAVIGEEYLSAKERVIGDQQVAIRELSTPVLQISDELLLLPVVGVIDSQRARQMTDQLLHSIRDNRAKVVVIDITGVPAVDSMVANHLVQAVEASRLVGARAILTGLSAEVAQTLVKIGVDLEKVMTAGNLQTGLEEARRLTGHRLIKTEAASE
jgi:rsbT co-antagonist protein RsbR